MNENDVFGSPSRCAICDKPNDLTKAAIGNGQIFYYHTSGSNGANPCYLALINSLSKNHGMASDKEYVKIIENARAILRQKKIVPPFKKIVPPFTIVSQIVATKEKNVDPYKAHEEALKKDSKYQQYLLNQNTCDFCSGKGAIDFTNEQDAKQHNIISFSKDWAPSSEPKVHFLHKICFHAINDFTVIFCCSFQESFDRLKVLFKNKTIRIMTQKTYCETSEEKVLCSSDFSKNPWNK
jgi:hypothetical protein